MQIATEQVRANAAEEPAILARSTVLHRTPHLGFSKGNSKPGNRNDHVLMTDRRSRPPLGLGIFFPWALAERSMIHANPRDPKPDRQDRTSNYTWLVHHLIREVETMVERAI